MPTDEQVASLFENETTEKDKLDANLTIDRPSELEKGLYKDAIPFLYRESDSKGPIGITFDKTFPPEFAATLLPAHTEKVRASIEALGLEVTQEQLEKISREDLEENLISRYALARSIVNKQSTVDAFLQYIVEEDATRHYDSVAKGSLPSEVVDVVVDDLKSIKSQFDALNMQMMERATAGDFDFQSFQDFRARYVYLSSKASAELIGLDRVSADTNRHHGLTHEVFKEHFAIDSSASGYTREVEGPMTQLLSINLAHQYGLKEVTPECSGDIRLFSSGMGALSTVLESAARLPGEKDIVVTGGIYFEVEKQALDKGLIKEVTAVDEKFYGQFGKQVGKKTEVPLVVFAQPFSSGFKEQPFDLNRVLDILDESKVTRPVYLVLDTTMSGSTLKDWERIQRLNGQDKKVTMIRVESLLKQSQNGDDHVSGGFAMSFGHDIKMVSEAVGSAGTILTEYNAANLFPFDSGIQAQRIERAGHNAKKQYELFHEGLEHNPIVSNIYYGASAEADKTGISIQYESTPPILFMKFTDAIPAEIIEKSVRQILGYDASERRDLARGTSYGFDYARYELMAVTDGLYLRLAGGQQSEVDNVTLNRWFVEHLNSEALRDKIKSEIHSAVTSAVYINQLYGDTIDFRTGFNEDALSTKPSAQFVDDLSTREVRSWLGTQYQILGMVEKLQHDDKLRAYLGYSSQDVSAMLQGIEGKTRVDGVFEKWALTTPEFITKLREKIPVLGKNMSPTAIYSIADTVIRAPQTLSAAVFPIRNAIKQAIQEITPELYVQLGLAA